MSGKVKVGRATVSWGPQTYGADRLVANCPITDIDDLMEAVSVARAHIQAAAEFPRPERIQRKRTAGWRIPEGAVYVGRPTKWGNPFEVESTRRTLLVHDGLHTHWETQRNDDAHALAHQRTVDLYRSWLENGTITGLTDRPRSTLPARLARIRGQIIGDVKTLAGRDLVCWCAPQTPCHADVLLELANA